MFIEPEGWPPMGRSSVVNKTTIPHEIKVSREAILKEAQLDLLSNCRNSTRFPVDLPEEFPEFTMKQVHEMAEVMKVEPFDEVYNLMLTFLVVLPELHSSGVPTFTVMTEKGLVAKEVTKENFGNLEGIRESFQEKLNAISFDYIIYLATGKTPEFFPGLKIAKAC